MPFVIWVSWWTCLLCFIQARWQTSCTRKKTLSPLWRTISEQRRTNWSVLNGVFVYLHYTCACVWAIWEEFKVADFIMSLESHLICPFCDRWADKLDSLSVSATQDPEGFLGHPVNAFKLMKRLNTEWGDLENLVLSDTTDGRNERNVPDSSAVRAKKVDFKQQGALYLPHWSYMMWSFTV